MRPLAAAPHEDGVGLLATADLLRPWESLDRG
jgi:hypothetical protein